MSSIAYSAVSGALALTAVSSLYQAANVGSSKTSVFQSALNSTIGSATNQAAQKQRQQVETLFYTGLGIASGVGSAYSMAQLVETQAFQENLTALLNAIFGKKDPTLSERALNQLKSFLPRTVEFISQTWDSFNPKAALDDFRDRIQTTYTAAQNQDFANAAWTVSSTVLSEVLSWVKFSTYHSINAATYCVTAPMSAIIGTFATIFSPLGALADIPRYLLDSVLVPLTKDTSTYVSEKTTSSISSLYSTLEQYGIDKYLPREVPAEVAKDATTLYEDLGALIYAPASWGCDALSFLGRIPDTVIDLAWGAIRHRYSILTVAILTKAVKFNSLTKLVKNAIFKPHKTFAALESLTNAGLFQSETPF